MAGISLEELERRENSRGQSVDALPAGSYRYRENGVERIVEIDLEANRRMSEELMQEWQATAAQGERDRLEYRRSLHQKPKRKKRRR